MTEKTYHIIKITGTPTLEEMKENRRWQTAPVLADFQYPWAAGTPSPTRFQALHSEDHFYFRFQAVDAELNAIVVDNEQMEVAGSDRVEIFFRRDAHLSPYYCLEMDYLGRVLENSAVYHRQMDYDWRWPPGLETEAQVSPDGYEVRGRISKASLQELGLLRQNRLEVGLFRADYRQIPGKDELEVSWISWVNPAVAKPDFHVPSAFGILQLEP